MAHQAGAYPGFCSMKRLGIFLLPLPLNGMLVHRRVTPSPMPFYTPGWREALNPDLTQTARSGDERHGMQACNWIYVRNLLVSMGENYPGFYGYKRPNIVDYLLLLVSVHWNNCATFRKLGLVIVYLECNIFFVLLTANTECESSFLELAGSSSRVQLHSITQGEHVLGTWITN